MEFPMSQNIVFPMLFLTFWRGLGVPVVTGGGPPRRPAPPGRRDFFQKVGAAAEEGGRGGGVPKISPGSSGRSGISGASGIPGLPGESGDPGVPGAPGYTPRFQGITRAGNPATPREAGPRPEPWPRIPSNYEF